MIFGYDYFIDEQFKVWLIEINTNPCLEESSGILRMLLPRMVGTFPFLPLDDALKLTVDLVFPRKRKRDPNEPNPPPEILPSIYKVTGYPDVENMWEYLCQIGIVKAPTNYKAATATLYKSATKSANNPSMIAEEHPREEITKEEDVEKTEDPLKEEGKDNVLQDGGQNSCTEGR